MKTGDKVWVAALVGDKPRVTTRRLCVSKVLSPNMVLIEEPFGLWPRKHLHPTRRAALLALAARLESLAAKARGMAGDKEVS